MYAAKDMPVTMRIGGKRSRSLRRVVGAIARRCMRKLARRWPRDPKGEWQRRLQGRISIGAATRITGAQLVVRCPLGCRLKIGSHSDISCNITLERQGAKVQIGSRTYIGGSTVIAAANSVTIGDDVLISFGVLIMDHDSHSLSFLKRKNDVLDWLQGKKDWTHVRTAPVKIADKAWIGARAIVLKGIHIGEGAVVGTGSVVTSDVPPWTVVAGNPARTIRTLGDEERGTS